MRAPGHEGCASAATVTSKVTERASPGRRSAAPPLPRGLTRVDAHFGRRRGDADGREGRGRACQREQRCCHEGEGHVAEMRGCAF